jgi:DEAD/DEAH box helicase domain-containing protein
MSLTLTKIDPSLAQEAFQAQIVFAEEVAARAGKLLPIPTRLNSKSRERLSAFGINQLFSHQAAAVEAALAGEDVVVATGTNSGKSLCYALPTLHWLSSEPASRALYLFPTKALAQDQAGRLQGLAGDLLRVGVYDGDTVQSQRAGIRKLADVIITNPDMLHVGILPGHENWSRFFRSLRVIVIDEMHVYRGVFGSNVAQVLRRLLRLCAFHKSHPQVIACSATIGNPGQHFLQLTGRKATPITEDGSPQAKRAFYFWNPPHIAENQRLSTNLATAEILASLADAGKRSLAFNGSRVSAELVLKYTRDRLQNAENAHPDQVESYRAGYTPKERREIEQALFKGKLLAVSATNAMELGVDIGGLDAVVMNGYPGSIASFFQQAGRAGRGDREGIAIWVARDDPLEQYLLREPQRLLHGTPESVCVHTSNPHILANHLKCAAYERPFSPTEVREAFGDTALDLAEQLEAQGELRYGAGLFQYPSFEAPAPGVNIRGSSSETITLSVGEQDIGTMEYWRALQSAHEGAVYLHRGRPFVVSSLDLIAKRAELEDRSVPYYTQSIVQSTIERQLVLASNPSYGASLTAVSVTTTVDAYRKKSLDGDSVLSVEPLDLPPQTIATLAVEIDLPDNGYGEEEDKIGAIHALEHAMMSAAPLLAGCDRNDLGSTWYGWHPDTMKPILFVYDQTPGGVGLCERLFADLPAWLSAAHQILRSCPCQDGCPGCLLSARCEVNNDNLSKPAALKLLRLLTA